MEEWKQLFAVADKRFDLVRCRFLIGMLGWMAAVDPEVDAVCTDYGAYVEGRSLWTDEWYRTASFLLPAASGEAFEALLRGDQGRVLELQGSGGYGKTMHVRWLIARRCVPAQARIPCARIDFDAVDPIAATREPYLVLLAMADQLDRQLPGDAFGKLVRTYAADLVRLYRRVPAATIPTREIRDSPDAQTRAAAADKVLRSFAGRLAEIPPGKPVVLILDTLEVPLHLPDTPQGPAVQPLMTALAEALKAPCVRLVLAGRYEIPEAVTNLFPKAGAAFVLPKFSPGEARTYLVAKRHIERDELVEAAVQAADGTPFSLALLADLISEHPAISPGTIAEYRGAEYAYLIERVVKRISEQPVRWVLRYACVPRRFDYEFVRDVLWPRVREEMSGTGGHDLPADDDIPHEDDGNQIWAVGAEPAAGEQAVLQVWDQVKRYASGSSWISPDEADPDALRLQAEVVRPLRELLRENEIFSVLHADAVPYFLRRAAAGGISPGRLTEYLREAVFHRFQFEGEAASRWWQEQLRAAAGPVARRALAGELARGLEYTDQHGTARVLGPRRHPGVGTDPAAGAAGVLPRQRRAGHAARHLALRRPPLAGRQRRARTPAERPRRRPARRPCRARPRRRGPGHAPAHDRPRRPAYRAGQPGPVTARPALAGRARRLPGFRRRIPGCRRPLGAGQAVRAGRAGRAGRPSGARPVRGAALPAAGPVRRGDQGL